MHRKSAVCLKRTAGTVGLAATLLLTGFGGCPALLAGKEPPARSSLAVDSVRLRSGEKLRGAVLRAQPDGTLQMAVQRSWLRTSLPDLYRTVIRDELMTQQALTARLIDRTDAWLADVRADSAKGEQNKRLVGFLQEQRRLLQRRLDRLQSQQDSPDDASGLDTQFILMNLAGRRVASRTVRQPEHRRVALLAWQERFERVEELSVEQLRTALESHGIDTGVSDTPVDLSARVPPIEQSDEEWAARQAIIEYLLVQPLDFQGLGGTLIRTDAAAGQPDIAALLPQLLQSQLTRPLQDLLEEPGRPRSSVEPPPDWALQSAVQDAEKLGRRGFRVSELKLDLSRNQVQVVERFVARMPDGDWKTVWSSTSVEDARQPRPAVERQIANDPQVKQIVRIAEQLGGAGDQVTTAIRFGAATMSAQQTAESHFYRFRDRCTQRLDGPLLTLPP